jgi:hypothetical protein
MPSVMRAAVTGAAAVRGRAGRSSCGRDGASGLVVFLGMPLERAGSGARSANPCLPSGLGVGPQLTAALGGFNSLGLADEFPAPEPSDLVNHVNRQWREGE